MRRPTVEKQPDGTLRAVTRCFACKRELKSERTLTWDQLDKIEHGVHVQAVLPDWTPAERELHFISGMCGKCWDETFGKENDDETV